VRAAAPRARAAQVHAELRNYDWPQGARRHRRRARAVPPRVSSGASLSRAAIPRSPRLVAPPPRAAALLFDCDGVLADTERDGHRVTFNAAFEAKGLAHRWSVEEYGELLKIGGGKERMTKCALGAHAR
jgi:hypothetical protein